MTPNRKSWRQNLLFSYYSLRDDESHQDKGEKKTYETRKDTLRFTTANMLIKVG